MATNNNPQHATGAAAVEVTPVNDPSVPPSDGTCLWWKLPLELRENIYELGYVFSDTFKVLTPTLHAERQTAQNGWRTSRVQTSLPELFIERFLPNKQWYAEASRAFFGRTHFRFKGHVPEEMLGRDPKEVPQACRFIIRITIFKFYYFSDDDLSCLRSCTSLKHLHLTIEPFIVGGFFFNGDPASPGWDAATQATLCQAFGKLKDLRGLNKFTIEVSGRTVTNLETADERTTFAENMSIVERTLQKLVVLPKEVPTFGPKEAPGYKTPVSTSPVIRKLHDTDIPLDTQQLQVLWNERPEDVMAWMLDARRRLAR